MDWSLGKLSKLLRKTKKTFANQMSLSPKLKTLRKKLGLFLETLLHFQNIFF